MTARSLSMSFAVLGVCLATAAPARAHRLDEYLQATRLSIDVERVGLEIDLTPGVAVATEVFAWIDTNRDSEISNAEREAYARQVLRSIELLVDNRPMPITLVEIDVPPFREMSLGVGSIRVRATASVSTTNSGHHQLSYLNTHRSESSVYLVNALVPADRRIQLGGQRRDNAQHGLRLDYTVIADTSWARTCLALIGLVMAGVLAFTRWPGMAHGKPDLSSHKR